MAKKKNANRRNMNQTAVIRQLLPQRERITGPDKLLAALHEPLPDDTVSKIIELRRQKIPRSQIAKKLGLSKLQVNHELMKRGG